MNGISLALQRGNPVLLAAAILVAVAVSFWAYRRTMPPLPPSSRRLLGILRFASFAILIGILFDPLVTFEKIETIRPNVVLLVDRSTSMGIVDGDDEGEQERRIDRAEELIGESGGGLKEKIRRRYGLSEHGFAVGLTDAAGAEGGDRTDLSLSLEEAIESEWERGVDGIVLVSDGIVNAGRDPVVVAEETGVPIFPVPVGDPDPVRDVALEQVLANPLVFVNSRVQVEVTLRGKGFAGEETPVRIFDGERVVAEETIRFTGKRESRTVSLGFPVHDEGIRRYTVRVPVADGERVEENNTLLFTVEAVKERLEVLLLSERPGWDFTFLKRSLDRDPNVHTACYIQSKDGSPRSGDGGAAPGAIAAERVKPVVQVVAWRYRGEHSPDALRLVGRGVGVHERGVAPGGLPVRPCWVSFHALCRRQRRGLCVGRRGYSFFGSVFGSCFGGGNFASRSRTAALYCSTLNRYLFESPRSGYCSPMI